MVEKDLTVYQTHNRIAYITLNRPEKKNALNPDLIEQLTAAFVKASEDEQVKVIVLKARGDVFSAGIDLVYLKQLQANTIAENIEDSQKLKKLYTTIAYLPKIVIAQIEGHAIAGGCGLAAVCDIVFAVNEAKFGYTEVKLGFVPALVSCFLIRKTSETIVKKILLAGELFNAKQALAYNLITYITNKDQIHQKVTEFALNLCNNTSGNSLMVTKQLINQTTFSELEKSLDLAVQINARVRESDDFNKGVSAFLNKTEIKW